MRKCLCHAWSRQETPLGVLYICRHCHTVINWSEARAALESLGELTELGAGYYPREGAA